MRKATLTELERKTHDLTDLVKRYGDEFGIGRRDPHSDTQAEILLGEKDDGEPDAAKFIIDSISRRQAVITYNPYEDRFYIEDCSTHETTRINNELLRKGEKRLLENGVSLYFGKHEYGPLTFREEI